MAGPFSLINSIFGPPIPVQAQNNQFARDREISGARAKIMARAGELLQQGIPPDQLLRKIMVDPVMMDGVAQDPEIDKVIPELTKLIQQQSLPQGQVETAPGGTIAQPDAAGNMKTVYSNPNPTAAAGSKGFGTIGPGQRVLNQDTGELGAGVPTEKVQTATGIADIAGMDDITRKPIFAAMLLNGQENLTEKEKAFYGPEGLVAKGLVTDEFAKKALAGQFEVFNQMDAAGNVIGKTIVDRTTGQSTNYASAPDQSPTVGAAPTGQTGTQPAPLGQGAPQPAPLQAPAVPGPQGAVDMGRAEAAIANNETGGQRNPYTTVGPMSSNKRTGLNDRPLGKYQVMTSNLPSWTKEVFGRSMTPREFLANPDAQDQLFRTKFEQSVAKYGNVRDAASVWFTGRPYAEGLNAKDVLGTSGQAYVEKFMANYGEGGANGPDVALGAEPSQNGNEPTPDGKQPVESFQLANPADMFLGASALAAGKETLGNFASGVTGENKYLGAGEQGKQRSALRNLQAAVVSLGDNSKISNTELKYSMAQVQNLGLGASPTQSIVDALNFRKFIEDKRVQAEAEINDPRQIPDVKKQAYKDIQSFDYVLNAMPAKPLMEQKYQELNRGEGGAFSVGDAIGEALSTITNATSAIRGDVSKGEAKGTKAIESATDRTGAIAKMSLDDLKGLVNANPPLTDSERSAASARLRQLRTGGQ